MAAFAVETNRSKHVPPNRTPLARGLACVQGLLVVWLDIGIWLCAELLAVDVIVLVIGT
jgi:hypothetical protein